MSRAETQGPMLAAGSVRTISECDVMKSVTPTRPGAACDGAIPVTQTAVITAARLSHRDAQTARVRVLIAHDTSIVGLGLHSVVARAADMEVVGQTTQRDALLSLARERQADVVIIDAALRFAEDHDYEAPVSAVQVVAELNRAGIRGIFVLAANNDEETFFRFLLSGAAAYVSPSLTSADLQDLLRRVGRGEYLHSCTMFCGEARPAAAPSMRAEAAKISCAHLVLPHTHRGNSVQSAALSAQSTAPLSSRECEVLQLVAAGEGNKQIGKALEISDQTVKNHLTEILKRLGANDRTHAVVEALKRGIIRLSGTARSTTARPIQEAETSHHDEPDLLPADDEVAQCYPADLLSNREVQVLQLAMGGQPYEQMGKVLGIAGNTVQYHMSSVMAKLGATNRRQAAALAIRHGLVKLPDASTTLTVLGHKCEGAVLVAQQGQGGALC